MRVAVFTGSEAGIEAHRTAAAALGAGPAEAGAAGSAGRHDRLRLPQRAISRFARCGPRCRGAAGPDRRLPVYCRGPRIDKAARSTHSLLPSAGSHMCHPCAARSCASIIDSVVGQRELFEKPDNPIGEVVPDAFTERVVAPGDVRPRAVFIGGSVGVGAGNP